MADGGDRADPDAATVASEETLPPRPAMSTPDPGVERYELRERLGSGGMGVVWAAHDRALDRIVALKVLHDRFLGAADQERLAAEARAMARLTHRNVVAVYDVGEREGRTFLTMELVRGHAVSQWLRTPRRWQDVVAVFRAAGAGLAAAHAAGIVHRDIKPSNILIADDGEVRVADFGVARAGALPEGSELTATASFVGTPAYMPPERLRGEPADARGDQFSFCAALYEALHGVLPFRGHAIDELAAAIDAGPPPPVRDAPRWLHAIVARGLAADPARRFDSMRALLDALHGPRRRAGWITALAALVVAAGAVTAIAWPGGDAPRTPAPAVTPPLAALAPPSEHVDLTGKRELTSFGGCAYSPTFADDDTIVFDYTLGDEVDLYKVPRAGGAPVRLTSDPEWDWRASAGRRPGEVVYLSTPMTTAGKTSVVFLDVASGVERERLAIDAVSVAYADGAIYYADGAGKYVRRRAGDRDEIVARTMFGEMQIAAAPDGRVAIVGAIPAARIQLCLAEPGATAPTCLPDQVRVRESRPAFTSNGDALYYAAVDGIHRRDVPGGADALVFPHSSAHGGIAISPDRRSLVWSACWANGTLVDLSQSRTVVRDDPDLRLPVTGPGGRLAWIEDGVAPKIQVQGPDGSIVDIVDDVESPSGVSFDRDGARIAFSAQGARHGIYVTNSRGGAVVAMVTGGDHDDNPFWTADGRIAFTRFDEHRVPHVYLVSPDGGAATHALDSRVTLGVRAATGEILLGTGEKLFWWDPTTGRERGPIWKDTGTIVSAAVSPDGRWLAVHTGPAGNELWRLRLDERAAPELVATLTASESISDGVAIDDRGHVLASPRAWKGELFVVPLLRAPR